MGWMDAAPASCARASRRPSRARRPASGRRSAPELEGSRRPLSRGLRPGRAVEQANPGRGVMPHALDPDAAERLWALSVERPLEPDR